MARLWARIIVKHRIARQMTAPCVFENPQEALTEICRELDIPCPLWLNKHEREFEDFRHTAFLPEHFMEEVPFQKLEIEFLGGCYNTLGNEVLAQVAHDCMENIQGPQWTEEELEFANKLNLASPQYQKMKDAGVTVTDVDKAKWKEAAAGVYDELDSLGLNKELVEKIQACK